MTLTRQVVDHLSNTLVNLGALATKTAITAVTQIDGGRENGVFIKKIKAAMNYRNLTSGEGPLEIGLCVGLTAGEVAEAIVSDPQSRSDVPAVEETNRRVFPLWMIGLDSVDGPIDMQPIKEIEDWPFRTIEEGSFLAWYVFNHDASALTSGGSLTFVGVAVSNWMDD